MRQSAAIGIAVYVALMGGAIGGAYVAFHAIVGSPRAQTASLDAGKIGPGVPNSRKWTPVEIRREVAQQAPLPAYVVPSSAARALVAKNLQKAEARCGPGPEGCADVPAKDSLVCAGSIGLRTCRRGSVVWPIQLQVLKVIL
jgi:hypothetical protein